MKDFKDILLYHFKHYPLMTERDLYKLVFHSAMGPGHAVTDKEMIRKWMHFEVTNLETYKDKNILDELCPGSGLVRVNIRPFIKNGGDPEKLCDAFIETANTFQPNNSKIRKLWGHAEELARENRIKLIKKNMDSFILDFESKAYPVAHHSDIYRDNYKPAYRVVSKEIFDAI